MSEFVVVAISDKIGDLWVEGGYSDFAEASDWAKQRSATYACHIMEVTEDECKLIKSIPVMENEEDDEEFVPLQEQDFPSRLIRVSVNLGS